MPIQSHEKRSIVAHRSNGTTHHLQLTDSNELKVSDDDLLTQLTSIDGNIVDVENLLTSHTTELQAIKNNTANIKASIEVGGDLYVSQDGVEALLTSGNATLSSIDNKVILPSVLDSDRLKVYDSAVVGSLAQINNNVDDVEAKLDTINTTLTGGGVVNISTLSTHALQTTINNTLGDANNKIDAMRASDSLTTVKTAIDSTNTKLDTLEASLTSMESKQDDQESTLNAIQTAVELLDNCISGAEAQVDVVTMPAITGTVTANLSATDNAVLDAIAVDGDNIQTKLDTLNTSLTNGTTIAKVMGSEDGATTGTQRQLHVDGSGNVQTNVVNTIFQVPANSANSHITDDPANAMAVGLRARTTIGTATTEQFLNCNSAGSLSVATKKTYSSETSIISGQSVAGSGTHTTASIANDANITEYIVEHNFSGSDVSFEILESIDNSNFFNAMGGMSYNEAGDPSAGITGINAIQIKSPYFKVKFTNGNGSSRDVTLSYVAIQN